MRGGGGETINLCRHELDINLCQQSSHVIRLEVHKKVIYKKPVGLIF